MVPGMNFFFFVKHNSIPNDGLLPTSCVRKGRILFNYDKDPEIHASLFFCFDTTFKFEEVVPGVEYTKEKV